MSEVCESSSTGVQRIGSVEMQRRRIGIIAGAGRLPILVAEGIRDAGGEAFAIGLQGSVLDETKEHCDRYRAVGVAHFGKWVRTFRRWGIREAVMVGSVAHTKKYARFQFLHYLPDYRAALLWYRKLRHDRRTATILTVLADELGAQGITLMDNRTFIPDHLALGGVMTKTTPTALLQRDIDFGWELITRAVELDFGQAMAVRGCDVIAVEAAEGSNAMIERAGQLAGNRPWVFLKTSSPDHDMRADVPTVGVETVERLHNAGAKAMVLGADRVIMLDREDVIRRANELGIAIVGME